MSDKPTISLEAINQAKYKLVKVDEVIPYEFNSKIHSDEQIRKLAGDISRHGLNYPILLDKNMVVIAGHGRLMAFKFLGMKFIPARVLDHLTDEEVKIVRINDNKTSSNEYDNAMVKIELEAINIPLDQLISEIAIDENEISKLLMKLDEIEPSAFTENLDKDVDRQAQEAKHDISKADLKMVPIHTALGFKTVTAADNRKIARFIGSLQAQYETDDSAEAFLRFISDIEAA